MTAARVETVVGVLGLPRSGTTMFSAVLDAHPDVVSIYEPWNANKALIAAGKKVVSLESLLAEGRAHNPAARVLAIKETGADHVYADNLAAVLQEASGKMKRRLIVLLRDPLHCFLSEVEGRQKWWGEASLEMTHVLFTNWARRSTRSLRQFMQLAWRTNGAFVFYEACVLKPVPTFTAVMRELGLAFTDEQLLITRNSNLSRIRGDMSLSENARDVEDASIGKRNAELDGRREMLAGSPLFASMSGIAGYLAEHHRHGVISASHPMRLAFFEGLSRLVRVAEKAATPNRP